MPDGGATGGAAPRPLARPLRICVLGTHSFLDAGTKVGTQHIAQTLARRGHDVHYLPAYASPLTLPFPRHRAKYLRSLRPTPIERGLLEITPVAPLPARVVSRVERLRGGSRVGAIAARPGRTRGGLVERAAYDVCVFSAAGTMTLLPRIAARRLIYRQNDLLREFAATPRALLAFEDRVLRTFPLECVCPVNEPLAEYCRSVNPDLAARVVPNGLDVGLFDRTPADPELARTRETNVAYVGAVEFWVDVDLLLRAAAALPGRAFHVYGPWHVPVPPALPPNVHVHGAIPHAAVPAKMKACAVGLIPSGPQNAGRMVVKPIKYFEYLAAGMGVAATSHAGTGLEPLAAVGDTPEAFAAAILRAREIAERRRDEIRHAVEALDWGRLVPQIVPGS